MPLNIGGIAIHFTTIHIAKVVLVAVHSTFTKNQERGRGEPAEVGAVA